MQMKTMSLSSNGSESSTLISQPTRIYFSPTHDGPGKFWEGTEITTDYTRQNITAIFTLTTWSKCMYIYINMCIFMGDMHA